MEKEVDKRSNGVAAPTTLIEDFRLRRLLGYRHRRLDGYCDEAATAREDVYHIAVANPFKLTSITCLVSWI